jgi:cobaltochelatase CobN
MKIGAAMLASHVRMLKKTGESLGFEIIGFGNYDPSEGLESPEEAMARMENVDVILIQRHNDVVHDELFWDGVEKIAEKMGKSIPVISLGRDPARWIVSTVKPEIVATCQAYILYNGEKNYEGMLRYVAKNVLGKEIDTFPPEPVPWEGIYHPRSPSYFTGVKEYLRWYDWKDAPWIGFIMSRHAWVQQNTAIEDALIAALEAEGMNVIPVFTYSMKDSELGSRSPGEVIQDYFMADGRPLVDGIIRGVNNFLNSTYTNYQKTEVAANGIELLRSMGVPMFQPILASYKTVAEWEASDGLTDDVAWAVAMPEFEGSIDPIIIGSRTDHGGDDQYREPIPERCASLAKRIKAWIALRNKPAGTKRVAFILHNSPCAGLEASVGGAASLDSLESVAAVLKRMAAAGYSVEAPESGKALIDEILKKKALSEFRWTTAESIVSNGGALDLLDLNTYRGWFDALSPGVRDRVCEAWGRPPGELKDGIPPAMLYDGKIIISGVSFGNAVVCVQPKRGCAGARCDGQVCKILHDPAVPPTHQYIATYRYLREVFKADVLVHVGTHGNLEFLPGKGVGLSKDCFPDICMADMPHLYIYNADNPPEGTIAKRRSNAVLVDHMQTVLMQGGLYDGLEELDRLLGEYETARYDKARAHALSHLILASIERNNLNTEIRLTPDMPVDEVMTRTHEALSRIRNTRIQSGMHVFGHLPQGEKRVEFINEVMRFETGDESLRNTVARIMGVSLSETLAHQGEISPSLGVSNGVVLERIDRACKALIRMFLAREPITPMMVEEKLDMPVSPEFIPSIEKLGARAIDIDGRIEASDEIGSLLSGFEGRYIPSGPSGLVTRGRDDVLPTGRNFYSLDPFRVPTKAASMVGWRLADTLLDKHLKDKGEYPENVAFYWMCSDIMYADGEGLAQMLYLLGTRPVWRPNGRVGGFEVIPLAELGRPRIDITVRVSGITRDNFSGCIELLDEAIQAVASLEEPPEMNYPRKHSLSNVDSGVAADWRDATLRIFASKPGTYGSGVNLAVYASAWKDEKDLADIFIYWNGYAYGKGVPGKEARQGFVNSLKTVNATFNKVVSDEKDLFGCCCYFSNQGGMTAAARNLSGKDVKAYYGDTREPEHVEVRDLSDEIRRVVRTKLLNPKWIEGMKEHGYKGAGDIMKRVGRVYGWEASTGEVDDWVFDDITKTFVLDEVNRKFFEENNPYALEEIARRLLEANQRGLWDTDPELLEQLKSTYLEIEGWMEECAGDGEYQGGAIDILTSGEVEGWGERMKVALDGLHR